MKKQQTVTPTFEEDPFVICKNFRRKIAKLAKKAKIQQNKKLNRNKNNQNQNLNPNILEEQLGKQRKMTLDAENNENDQNLTENLSYYYETQQNQSQQIVMQKQQNQKQLQEGIRMDNQYDEEVLYNYSPNNDKYSQFSKLERVLFGFPNKQSQKEEGSEIDIDSAKRT